MEKMEKWKNGKMDDLMSKREGFYSDMMLLCTKAMPHSFYSLTKLQVRKLTNCC